MFDIGGDFDDDLFSGTKKKASSQADLQQVIRNYQPKVVYSKSLLQERAEACSELEDAANLHKTKADYYYWIKEYSQALDLYRNSLGRQQSGM